MNIYVYDNVLEDPDSYVKEVLLNGFEDVQIGEDLFKSVKQKGGDDITDFLWDKFPGHYAALNFVRQSPQDQTEPNFIHSDEMMGELTVITYLNKEVCVGDGTTIYNNDLKPICVLKADYNRMVVFESYLNHSRNIYENFGNQDSSRLIQVTFLKKL